VHSNKLNVLSFLRIISSGPFLRNTLYASFEDTPMISSNFLENAYENNLGDFVLKSK